MSRHGGTCRSVVLEPESEVHSDGEHKTQLGDELGERGQEISTLREVVRQQGLAIVELRKKQASGKHDVFRSAPMPASSAGDSKSYDLSFELDSAHMWSDGDDDSLPPEGVSSGIHASIEAIREEASRVDTVMALDQLDTLQQELNSVTKAMSNRTAEMKELRTLVQLKDDRVSTLELERDLYKADASKMKTDLQNCVDKIRSFDNSSTSEHSPVHSRTPTPSEAPSGRSTASSVSERRSVIHNPSNSREQVVRPNRDDRSMGRLSGLGFARAPSIKSVSSNVSTPLQPSRKDRVDRGLSRQRSRTFRPFRNKPVTKPNPKPKLQPIASPSIEMTGIPLQKEMNEMKERLVASMKASEELRKRLAMISRYYETLVRRMQENMVEVKSDRARMEVDLVHQISSIDLARQVAIEALEEELNIKDEEIEQLKTLIH